MAIFVRSPRVFPGLSLGKVPGIPTTINVNMFFDRAAVKSALTTMEYNSLTKASLLVRRTATKSIKKVGAAKTRLKVMRDNPNLSLRQLASIPGLRVSTRNALGLAIQEIQFPPASPPGSPPYTHVPSSHMLGFRRNLYNGYDKITHSAVVGPSKKGSDWGIPMLHEFGGKKVLEAWAWVPKYARYTKPIVRWVSPGYSPGSGGGWLPTGQRKTFRYPERPFMGPALAKSRSRIAKMFEGQFSAGLVRGPQ